MATLTTFRIADAFGVPLLDVANYSAFDLVLNCAPGGIGVLELTLPLSVDPGLLLEDGRIGVWRSIDGRSPYLDNGAIFLIRHFDYGPTTTFIRAFHANTLLTRRIIAYPAGSSYTSKAATFADDLIKTFVNENMLSGIVAVDRDGVETYADVSAYLTKAPNVSQGASVAISAARRNLMDACVDLANASATAGTYLTFEIAAPSESTLELRTYTGQRGVDRRAGTANELILSAKRGNLTDDHLILEYSAAASFVSAGGQGEETDRLIGTAMDVVRASASPFGRIEVFRDASNVSTQSAVDDAADSGLRGSRAAEYVTGTLVETPGCVRGIDFDLGDIVAVETRVGRQLDVRLDMVHESHSASGPGQGSALTQHQAQPRKVTVGLRSVT